MLYKMFLFFFVITVALSNEPNQGNTSERILVEASTRQEQDGMQVIIVDIRVQVKMFCHNRPETYWPEDVQKFLLPVLLSTIIYLFHL